MPNGINNWTYSDVKKFLNKRNFTLVRKKGSHHHYRGYDGQIRLVTVPFHGKNEAIRPRTMNSIIAQSGIDKKEWLA